MNACSAPSTELVRLRLASTDLDDERRRNWKAAGLLIDFAATSSRLETDDDRDPLLFWNIRARMGARRQSLVVGRVETVQLEWIIHRFRRTYVHRDRPSGVTSGDTNPWDAAQFLESLIRRLGADTTESAEHALLRLRDEVEDGYTETLKIALAEQRRKRVDAQWSAPNLETVRSFVGDRAPTTAVQLQAVVLEELDIVQRQLRGSDVNWYRDFSNGTTPFDENRCRNALLKMLRPLLPFGVQADPEGHLADDKRADIVCRIGDLIVPIEVKGQWHDELWRAADRQLDRLYVNDWRAEVGIYLVLWFGPTSTKALRSPPRGSTRPQSPRSLREALVASSDMAQSGRVEVVVLDFERPA